jgi:polyhydroxyalkanoate synthase
VRLPTQQIIVDATESIQGANPFVGMTTRQVVRAGARWAGRLASRPMVVASQLASWAGEEAKVVRGASSVTPDSRDRRFSDDVWQGGLWRRVLQSYLVTRKSILDSVDRLDLDPKSADRARFALMQVIEAAAPTNNLATNPVALRTAVDSRGRSVARGGMHLLDDLRHNGGLPSQVDTRPFRVGETVAATEGGVVYRTPFFELVHYRPSTTKVHGRPLVLIPPQINRFYFLDLAPGRSLVEYALSRGIQVFLISWRNPRPRHRDWGLDDYAESCVEAMQVASRVTGSESVNIAGFCAGGMTTSAVLAHLADSNSDLVHAATLAVTMIDADVHSTLNMFASERTLTAAVQHSRRHGILRGDALARMFAFVRPNELIWNYFVANYLLGQDPPAFDVLAWNKDATNLPARLHADFINMWVDNALVNSGSIKVLGTAVDLGRVRNELYIVGAATDHLVPWHSAYAGTQLFGGDVRFVLSNSGHVQALINPPGNKKASYLVADQTPASPEQWLTQAIAHAGSWWEDWVGWLQARSGDEVDAPVNLGSDRYPVLLEAPGSYVRQ